MPQAADPEGIERHGASADIGLRLTGNRSIEKDKFNHYLSFLRGRFPQEPPRKRWIHLC